MMGKERQLNKVYALRLQESTAELLAVKAKEQRCRESDVMRDALNEYLFKSVNDENLIFAQMASLKHLVEAAERKCDVLSRLFIFWLKYYFTYAPSLPQDKDAKKAQIQTGEKRKDVMLTEFKNDIKANPSLMERLVLEFFEFEDTAGGEL